MVTSPSDDSTRGLLVSTLLLQQHKLHPARRVSQQYENGERLPSFLTRERGAIALDDSCPSFELGKSSRTFLKYHHRQTQSSASASGHRKDPRTIADGSLSLQVPTINRAKSFLASTPLPRHSFKDTLLNITLVKPASVGRSLDRIEPTDDMADRAHKAMPPHLNRGLEAQHSAPTCGRGTKPSKMDSEIIDSEIYDKLSKLGVTMSTSKPTILRTGTTGTNTGQNGAKEPVRNDGLRDCQQISGRSDRGNELGRARGSNSRPTSRWTKKKDIPKIESQARDTIWKRDSIVPQEHSWASTAGAGWDTGERFQDGAPLNDWNNGWAPAPLDWENRSAFRPGQSVEHIEKWLYNTANEIYVSIDDFETVDAITYTFGESDGTVPDNPKTIYEVMGDVIPRSWIPSEIEQQSLQSFWQSHIRSDNPAPDDGIELSQTKPWWELLVRGSSFLRVPEQPPTAGIDPYEESTEQRLRREADKGSDQAAGRQKRLHNLKAAHRLEKRRKKEANIEKHFVAPAGGIGVNGAQTGFKPQTGFKMLVRFAQEEDMRDARDIINWYVDNSCVVPEEDRFTILDMLQKLREVRNRGLPYLIVCEPGVSINPRRRQRGRRINKDEPHVIPDRIIGFAYADDFNSASDLYRFIGEVKLFVKYDSLAMGVGKCLMDKLMAMLDPGYLERGDYAVPEELQNVTPERELTNVIIKLPYDNNDKFIWQASWLQEWMGFVTEADIKGYGSKHGKAFNLAIFRRPTAVELDHVVSPLITDEELSHELSHTVKGYS